MTAFGVVLVIGLSAAGLLISVIALLIGAEKQRSLQRKPLLSAVACLLLLIVSFSYGVFAGANYLLTVIGCHREPVGRQSLSNLGPVDESEGVR